MPFQVAAILIFFKGAKLSGLADAMAEVAVEAATRKGNKTSNDAVLPEPDEK